MKIILIGANGTLGSAIARELGQRHDIIAVGKRRGQYQIDMTRSDSIRDLFERVGKVDAIVSAAGSLHSGPLADMTADQFKIGLHDKLLGQVDLALIGQHYVNAGGSITLTSGILSDEPIRYGANAAAVNSAIDGFVRGAAVELQGIRINAVSPTVLQESLDNYGPYFQGFEAAPASRVALAFSRSVEGAQTGRVYRVW
ncbi:MAG: short chain dehydrogenase [Achromobacter mucicolens]|jgi:NAD(P)-dependent dehydrogenase (short-subunit alcohol dehydrogenase family)|uniref:short chain dehydrogenase n=1 Tax=Achromobacter mucicolens TaxID=1389922 RepID=UPI002432103D|nr:short chain dehydrogenase [Achromobacter mucicolens]MDF2860626.1 short chain dehydrogenase [Achromobacter mucicolens]